MSSVMSKKKKITIISLSIAAFLLIVAAVSALIWYFDSPIPTAMKLMNAVNDRDTDAMLDCIEPDKAKVIRMVLSFTGTDAGDLIDMFMPEGAGETGNTRVSGYHREGNDAYFEIEVLDDAGAVTDTRRINFVRIDGTWYLTFSLW